MPQYFSPGVYVEEVDAGPRPIAGVSTSVTGAVGVTVRGPTSGKPVLVTSITDFNRQFGGFMPEPGPVLKAKWDIPDGEGGYWWRFSHAVKGFFDNGGQQLFVKRVVPTAALASAAAPVRGPVSRVSEDAATSQPVVKVNFPFGLEEGTKVRIMKADGSAIDPEAPAAGGTAAPLAVESVNLATGEVTLNGKLSEAAAAGSFVVALTEFKFQANAQGAWGDGLTVKVDHTSAALTLDADVTANSKTIEVRGATRLYPGALLTISQTTAPGPPVVTNTESRRVVEIAGSQVTLSAPLTNAYTQADATLSVTELEVEVSYPANGTLETFSNLHLTGGSDPLSVANTVNKRSTLVSVDTGAESDFTGVTFPGAAASAPFVANAGETSLSGGNDSLATLSVDDFVGVNGGSGNRTGIQALEDVDDISIVLVPGMWAPLVHSAAILHCEQMRYRVTVLDPPPGKDIQGIRGFREPIDSTRATLYYPWLKVRDPILADNVVAPSSGHVAGIYARVDTERGVHKAPANEVIRGITGLNQDITRREQDLLNPEGINALRFFPGRGQRVWGARTVSSDSNFKYVNVRRIFNFIEASIDGGTQFVVFEPNDATLWARVRQTVGNFLNTQWRAGVLEGATPADAYFVECDRGVTMTQDDIENGRLICEVGIAPVYPAEFVIFRIQKYTADSKLGG